MRAFSSLQDYSPPPTGSVVTVGNFDGVHIGHRRVLTIAREQALPSGAEVVAITFEPHPLAILAPHRAPPPLLTAAERIELLERCGADAVITLHSTAPLFSRSAEDFLEWTVARCRPHAFVEGPQFYFGRDRAGSIATLRENAARLGYEAIEVAPVSVPSLPQFPRASSSAVRRVLGDGDVAAAATLLGRPHRISGQVGHGAGRGAPLGLPTANLEAIPQMTPAPGVYAGVAQLESEQFHLAAVNIGPQPTFGGATERVEAHLLDYAGDLRGQRIAIYLIERLRAQQRFASVDALLDAIRSDIELVRRHSTVRDAITADPPLSIL